MSKITLNKASKLLCISTDILKKDVKSGRLLMSDGCVDCKHLECLYPDEYKSNNNLEYFQALKETAGKWKDGAREKVEQLEKHHLVNQIRKLEAELYVANKRIRELEDGKKSKKD